MKMDTKTESMSSQPTYKPISEKELEDQAVQPRSLVNSKLATLVTDGADEIMLPKEEKIDITEKQASINEKQNGDAKLDIGDLRQAFVGLTKEELLKYAEDPFWVRLRWFLFITFWILWASMLVGAVMIIYAAPKCNPPPPRTWSQEGPLSEVSYDQIQLDDLKLLANEGVKGLIVKWPEDAYEDFNEMHNFVKLLNDSKESNINVIVELEPGASYKWFIKSQNKEPAVDDYYIWKSSCKDGEHLKPPNAKNNLKEASWICSQIRKEYFYAFNDKPVLNFQNPNVITEFSNVIKKFLNYGAKGIQIKGAENIFVDTSADGLHTKTENLQELGPLLLQWKAIIQNLTDSGPLMVSEDLNKIELFKVNGSMVVDLPVQSHLFTKSNSNATDIVIGLKTVFANITWPLWKYNGTDALDFVTYLLPGVPLINRHAIVNKELLKIRSSPSVTRGNFSCQALANGTVLAFIRVTLGNPGVLVAYNPTESRVVVNFTQIDAVSSEVTVQLVSNNFNETGVLLNNKHDAHGIPMSPNSAIVLSYVPKKKEG